MFLELFHRPHGLCRGKVLPPSDSPVFHVARPQCERKFGYTITEVLIAMLILGFTVTAVMQFMLTGDRINGRRLRLSYASTLASSQAEIIRLQEQSTELLGDTAYEESINGFPFKIERIRINPPPFSRPDSVIQYCEFSIVVKEAVSGLPLTQFRLLQGIHGQ